MENKLPEGWEWKKLSDLADFFYGGAFESSYFNEDGKGVKIIRIRNLKQGFTETYYAGEYDESYLVQNSDILIGMDGEFNIVKWTGKPALLNQRVCKLIIKSNDLLPDFAYRSLVKILKDIEDRTAFVTVKHLSAKHLNTIKIPVPPLETQQKIVSILEKAEETRKLRAQADELTQKLLQSVFLEIFGDPVTNPMGWNTEKLEKLCVKIYGGGTPSKSKPEYYEGDIPWVTPKDMKQDFIQDSIDHISEKAIEESSTKLIPPYSLLMVIRSGILKHTLPIAINNCKVTMNQDMKGFVFDDKLTNSFFMLYYFKIYQRDLLNRVRSVTADNLEFSQIKDIDVILPPIKQQQRFTTIVEQLDRTRSNQQQYSLEINSLFDALMQKAFTGKLVS